jgi:hypothetical protein
VGSAARPTGLPDLELRPRALFQLLAVVVPAAALGLLVWLSYSDGYFDPRILLLLIYAVAYPLVVLRARLVVADGSLWRRSFFGYQAVTLGDLAQLELRRPRYLKREGVVGPLVEVSDRRGRTLLFKPRYWQQGARPLLAGLRAAAATGGATIDEASEARLAQRLKYDEGIPPAWAATVASASALEVEVPASSAPAKSTFWVRRDELGRPRKAQPQLLLPMIGLLAVTVPAMMVVSRVGTHQLRSVRCSRDRHLWSNLPAAPEPRASTAALAEGVVTSRATAVAPTIFRIRSTDLWNSHNTDAVRADAGRLLDGYVIQWTDGGQVQAEVFIERFASATDAMQFHRDYAEDHCHAGDRAFAVHEIVGAVGFRCPCKSDTVDDRVSFVRGPIRLQAIVWDVRTRDGHDAAISLATATSLLAGPTPV